MNETNKWFFVLKKIWKFRTRKLLSKHIQQTSSECRQSTIETLYKYKRQQKKPFQSLANGIFILKKAFIVQHIKLFFLKQYKSRSFMDDFRKKIL